MHANRLGFAETYDIDGNACFHTYTCVWQLCYEKRYMEEVKLKSSEQIKDVAKEPSEVEIIPKSEAQQIKSAE
ncbi:hypothetical protein Dsin_005488 [Dipteronia sinensis]|uniref:Uncharacterized protein n=1 Tax=Dipteronia sinensis TaxID=43782 RepID=A0AAE0AWI3_9ROSI|nr:hypothetical protein Dsin_005488 [Dipteronia sinensis]